MKTNWKITLLISVLVTLSSCSSSTSQKEQQRIDPLVIDEDINENFYDDNFTSSELTYWLSYNKGMVGLDGSKVKISLTSNNYGGISSVYKTSIDFSKEVYLNFKDFETTNDNVSLLLKMSFGDYSKRDSAYVISNDIIGLNGDFSFNIDNALRRYGNNPSNMELFNNNELLFKNKKIDVSFYICAYNNANSGLDNDEAWIKFSSFNISYKDNKDIGALGSFNVSQDGINVDGVEGSNAVTSKKNSDSLLIKAKANGVEMEASEVIYASSNKNKVSISNNGTLSFVNVTKDSVRIVAYPRKDISIGGIFDYPKARYSKNSGFYVNVLGLWDKTNIYSNVLTLFGDETVISPNDDLLDLFEGNLLQKQNIKVDNSLKAISLVVSSSTLNIINNYSGSEEDKQEADANALSYSVKLAINNAGYSASSNVKASVVKCGKSSLELISKENEITSGSQYLISAKYLNDDYSKYTDSDQYLILWNDSENYNFTFFTTNVFNASEMHTITPQDIAKSFNADRSWDGLTSEIKEVGGAEVFRINLKLRDLTAFYAQPFIEAFADKYSINEKEYLKIDFSRNVQLVYDFGECENIVFNLRFNRIAGRYINEYWKDEGKFYTNLTVSNELFFVDLAHYVNKGNISSLIQLTIAKSLPVELCFDMSLINRTEVGQQGHLDVKNIYVLYQ